MAESIAVFASINFAVMGLSHILQTKAWHDFFEHLHSLGKPGAFVNGFLTLVMGSLIVAFHNVWTGVPVILTLVGWAYVLKSAAIFVYPEWNLRSMKGMASATKARVAGGVLLALAVTMMACVATGQY